MVIIYDFDGTLTPHSFPQYEVLQKCGYDDKKIKKVVINIMDSQKKSLYDAYFKVVDFILKDNDLEFNRNNICLGAESVVFNTGVLDFFENLKNKDIRHYVVSSGFEDYIRKTKIMSFLTDVYGTVINYKKDGYIIERLVTDEYKVQVIKQIISSSNSNHEDIIYIGDGLTDQYAFEYVHSIGGKTIFISKSKENNEQYISLNQLGIIDECFEPDFSTQKDIYQYIKTKIK